MKKHELFTLFHSLKEVAQFPGVKFAYAVAKNMKTLQTELECIEKAIEVPESYKEYDAKRVALVQEYAEKNEDGSPKIVNNSYTIPAENQRALSEAMAPLNEEYDEVLKARMKQEVDYSEMLQEETEFELVKISSELLPENINAAQITGIMAIIG